MVGEFEAAGTAIEGALLGAAVEGESRTLGADGTPADDAICLNCKAPLTGPFCAACGQKAEVHRTLSAIWHDILHSVLHFDGKLWRTLPMLAFRPGELTRRYVHGERARFVSPMALFLFAIFLMFAVFSFTGGSALGGDPGDIQRNLASQTVKVDKQISIVEGQLASGKLAAADKEKLERQLKGLKAERNGIAFATGGKPIYADVGSKYDNKNGVGLSAVRSDTGWKWFDNALNKGSSKMMANPGLALYKLQSNGYKFAWLLIPLSLPFVWLVTVGARGHRFYDHAVFTTYSIAFMCFLFLTVAILLRIGVSDDITTPALLLIPPIHIYRQLRHAYGFSRIGTLLRLSVLLFSILLIAILFATILLFLGLLG